MQSRITNCKCSKFIPSSIIITEKFPFYSFSALLLSPEPQQAIWDYPNIRLRASAYSPIMRSTICAAVCISFTADAT